MNINLISPKDNTILNQADKTNGHSYTIRFKDNILIPANSKVSLNFATMTRQSELSFIEDQIIYINFPDVIPYNDDVTGTIANFQNILPTNKGDATDASVGTQNFDGDITGTSAGNQYQVPIPKGFYTYERFYSVITQGINKALNFKADGTTATTSNNENYRASEIYDANPLFVDTTQSLSQANMTESSNISIGVLENIEYHADRQFEFDNKHLYAFEPNGNANLKQEAGVLYNGNPVAFVKLTANTTDISQAPTVGQKIFDSFALAKHNYRHTGQDDYTPLGKLNIFEVETLRTLDEISTDRASMSFGLFSQEVAIGINASNGAYPLNDTNRTGGGVNNVQPLQQTNYILDTGTGAPVDNGNAEQRKVPCGFIQVVISAEGDASGNGAGNVCAEVYSGLKVISAGTNPTSLGKFRSINEPFKGSLMARQKRQKLSNLGFDGDEPIRLGLQTYQRQDDPNLPIQKTYFRLLNLNNADMNAPVSKQKNIVIYDSYSLTKNQFFPTDFFFCRNTDIDYTAGTGSLKNNKVNSQLGLTPILACNTINHGFKAVTYRGVPRGTIDGIDYTAKPLTLYGQYYISASDELAETFNIVVEKPAGSIKPTDPTNQFLSPNTGIPQKKTTYTELSRGWRARSYSIFLRGLPLGNYKNTKSKTQGGFAKQILANVPLPFKDSLEHFNIKTTGLFMPSNPITTQLYNQDLSINHFQVDIKRMDDDKDAVEIEGSVVNFTIYPPDGYAGNVNAVEGYTKLPPSVKPNAN
tara:strand:+ start:88 stop:2358 length:2271 start_codon:yes stop_codon:yes gene_type:complete